MECLKNTEQAESSSSMQRSGKIESSNVAKHNKDSKAYRSSEDPSVYPTLHPPKREMKPDVKGVLLKQLISRLIVHPGTGTILLK